MLNNAYMVIAEKQTKALPQSQDQLPAQYKRSYTWNYRPDESQGSTTREDWQNTLTDISLFLGVSYFKLSSLVGTRYPHNFYEWVHGEHVPSSKYALKMLRLVLNEAKRREQERPGNQLTLPNVALEAAPDIPKRGRRSTPEPIKSGRPTATIGGRSA